MANCGTCKKLIKTPQETKNKLCDPCRKKKQDAEAQAKVKEQEAKSLQDKQGEMKKSADQVVKDRDTKEKRDKEIGKVSAQWNLLVTTAVDQVNALRKLNPKKDGINAGENNNVVIRQEMKDGKPVETRGNRTIPGGVDNAIQFQLPSSNPYKITKAEVSNQVNGYDTSDKGQFKFRRGTVLVHGE